MMRRGLVVGNWKMHGMNADLPKICEIAEGAAANPGVDVALCLPATLIERAHRVAPGLPIGGQDIHQKREGPYTGSVSAGMLLDAGARLSIVGHSERRAALRESDADIRAKAETGFEAGLGVILCVGESAEVRRSGQAVAEVEAQLRACLPRGAVDDPFRLAIAYEPIWCIGTGTIPTLLEIMEMHAVLRSGLLVAFGPRAAEIRILYGGSVNAANARTIFALPEVNGTLVGGASLDSHEFTGILRAAAVQI